MSEEKKNPEIVPTGETMPVDEAPEPIIAEIDRLRLAEVWNDLVATRNAITALQIQQGKLEAESRNAAMQSQMQTAHAEELQAKLQKLMQVVQQQYNLPEDASIDTKTGRVIMPEQEAPQGGPSLVQSAETPDGIQTAAVKPAASTPSHLL
jgi:hypothetical protein